MTITLTVEELKEFANAVAGWHQSLTNEIAKAIAEAAGNDGFGMGDKRALMVKAARQAQERYTQAHPEPTIARLLKL